MVSGGSSGIGRAVVERVASEGAAVVIGARRTDVGEAVAAGIRAAGGRALFAAADATVEADAAGLARTAVTEFGRLDGAFNNAGGVTASGAVQEVDAAAWRADLDQNLTIPAMLASGDGGAIVNNAAIAGVVGVPTMAAYVAAKHGVVGLTRAAALECAGQGVRVNALVTGNVDTPLFRSLLGAPPDGELEIAAMNPAGRIPDRRRSPRSSPSCSATKPPYHRCRVGHRRRLHRPVGRTGQAGSHQTRPRRAR